MDSEPENEAGSSLSPAEMKDAIVELIFCGREIAAALREHSAALREHAEALRLEAGGDEEEEITL